MHSEDNLREWFEKEYRPAIETTEITEDRFIHNIDEKGYRLAYSASEEIVVPLGITEIYVRNPENRLSITIIESICTNGKIIPPICIISSVNIIGNWFFPAMTGHEVVTVSDSRYTNESICMIWLDHFIKHNNYGPDKLWVILLINEATYHKAPGFVLKATIHKIWIIRYLPHQIHLLQPLDIKYFRQ